jgi:hypothetical protein
MLLALFLLISGYVLFKRFRKGLRVKLDVSWRKR